MRLSALGLPLAVAVAATVPGRVPIDTQHPFDVIESNEHLGHLFAEPPAFPPPSGHETIYETLSRDSRYYLASARLEATEEGLDFRALLKPLTKLKKLLNY